MLTGVGGKVRPLKDEERRSLAISRAAIAALATKRDADIAMWLVLIRDLYHNESCALTASVAETVADFLLSLCRRVQGGTGTSPCAGVCGVVVRVWVCVGV